ncbi:uncharacterized protein DNG_09279 [Cephalotrichum gorgonifer]|uniref:Uncharacterized protein n=1 Tax=Cephalotrichum gorgonifer TaxID=2041049 RepID=A0AAE8N700_9PEZI|nr:uncharacterized protein DNG_09279 [Cephalotrichum gorgonifer]
MDGLAPNDPNSLETGSKLHMNISDQHREGPADEQAVHPAGGGSSIEPIVIPGAEDMTEEEIEAMREFFERAGSDNTSLKDWERAFFLGREDVYGLAVALPGLLTQDQQNWIIGRPPPSIVREAIRAEFGVDSVADVFKRVHEDIESLDEGQFKLIMVAGVHLSCERRQVRRQRTYQRILEYQAMSPEEMEADRRDKEERRKVWMAGAAAREEREAEWRRWDEASSRLSDYQIAEMRRLRELGPEAVQQSFLESLAVVEGGIEAGEDSEMKSE